MARSESQLVIPRETGSESTGQPQQPQQPQQQQQQIFESEKNRMVVVVEACRDMVELEMGGKEQEEHLQLPQKQQQQQLQPPAAPPLVWNSQLVIPLLETGSESTAQVMSSTIVSVWALSLLKSDTAGSELLLCGNISIIRTVAIYNTANYTAEAVFD